MPNITFTLNGNPVTVNADNDEELPPGDPPLSRSQGLQSIREVGVEFNRPRS
jgi:hypothetical protein